MRKLNSTELKSISGGTDNKTPNCTSNTGSGATVTTCVNGVVQTQTICTQTQGSGSAQGSGAIINGAASGQGSKTSCTQTDVNIKTGQPIDVKPVRLSDNSDYTSGDLYAGAPSDGYRDAGGGDIEVGCVQVASILPCGAMAGDIVVGAVMQLGDERTLEAAHGVVSFSQRKKAAGYRITTTSGATLVCSGTAPIPTPEGIVLAPALAGKSVAVRRDDGNVVTTGWDAVASIESVGEIDIQHITVGDKCFWAGETANAYILHHNSKIAESC